MNLGNCSLSSLHCTKVTGPTQGQHGLLGKDETKLLNTLSVGAGHLNWSQLFFLNRAFFYAVRRICGLREHDIWPAPEHAASKVSAIADMSPVPCCKDTSLVFHAATITLEGFAFSIYASCVLSNPHLSVQKWGWLVSVPVFCNFLHEIFSVKQHLTFAKYTAPSCALVAKLSNSYKCFIIEG